MPSTAATTPTLIIETRTPTSVRFRPSSAWMSGTTVGMPMWMVDIAVCDSVAMNRKNQRRGSGGENVVTLAARFASTPAKV